ncbi:hypothetical protein I4U23_020166 [Adineta vaga]|nr:hypothetical protein I4U23_020166 [Adineta vaga]
MADIGVAVVDKLLSGLGMAAKKITVTASRVKANKAQSTRFAQRVELVVGYVTDQGAEKLMKSSMKNSLESFLLFLEECEGFIAKFSKKGFLGRIYSNSNHADKFHQLNLDLDRYIQDFSFGLHVNIFNRVMPENKMDAQLDLIEINQIINTRRTGVPVPAPPAPLSRLPVQPNANPTGGIRSGMPPNPTGGIRPGVPPNPTGSHANKSGHDSQPHNKNLHARHNSLKPPHGLLYHHHNSHVRNDSMYPHHHSDAHRQRQNSVMPFQQAIYPSRMQYSHGMNQFYH